METSPPFPQNSVAAIVNNLELKLKKLESENHILREEHWQVIKQYSQQNQQLQIATEANTKHEDTIKRRNSFLQQQNIEIDRLHNEIDCKDREIDNYKIKTEEFQNKLDQVKTDNEALKGKISSLPTEDDLDKLRSEFQESIDIKQNVLKEKCSEIDELEKALVNEREKCVTQHEKIVKLQGELNSAQDDLEKHKNIISEKDKEIGDSHSSMFVQWKTINENESKLKEITAQLEKLKEIISEKESEIKDTITENLKEKQEAEKKVQMLEGKLKKYQLENRGQKTSLDNHKELIKDLQGETSRLLKQLEENKETQKKLDKANTEVLEHEKKLIDQEKIIDKNENDKLEMNKNVKFLETLLQIRDEEICKFKAEREKMLGFLKLIRSSSEFPGGGNNVPIESQLEELRVHVQGKFKTLRNVHKLVKKDEMLVKSRMSTSSIGEPTLPSPVISLYTVNPHPVSTSMLPDTQLPSTSSNIITNVTPIDANTNEMGQRQGKNVKRKSGSIGCHGDQAGNKYLILDGPDPSILLEHHSTQTNQQIRNVTEPINSEAMESGNHDGEIAMKTETLPQSALTLLEDEDEDDDVEFIDLTDN